MTSLRLAGKKLFVHSPTPYCQPFMASSAERESRTGSMEPIAATIDGSAEWRAAFPDAAIYLAPCTKQQAGDRLGFDGLARDAQSGHPWDAEIETLPIARGCDERPATLHP